MAKRRAKAPETGGHAPATPPPVAAKKRVLIEWMNARFKELRKIGFEPHMAKLKVKEEVAKEKAARKRGGIIEDTLQTKKNPLQSVSTFATLRPTSEVKLFKVQFIAINFEGKALAMYEVTTDKPIQIGIGRQPE